MAQHNIYRPWQLDELTPIKTASAEQTATPEKVALTQSGLPRVEDEDSDLLGSDDEDEELYEEFRQTPAATPNSVRSRMRKLITEKGLKVKDIQALIGERPGPAWNKFMNGKYKDQSWAYSNDAYRKAAFFLFKEKRLGKGGRLAGMAKKDTKMDLPDLSQVLTDGKTYLTPTECRRSLLGIFKKYSLTQSKLARMISQNAVMVGRFMTDSGEFGGSEKSCYHAIADFCEKMRIATGAKKSRKRLAIDAEGRDCPYLGDDGKRRYVVTAGTNLLLARDAIGRQIVRCQ